MKEPEYPCPVCGSETEWSPECPTYRRSGGWWMRCTPVCGNASSYSCPKCGWQYLVGVNWGNPNYDAAEQGERPDWIGVDA